MMRSLLIVLLALLAGCTTPEPRVVPDPKYVAADEQTYGVVAESWAAYVASDTRTDATDKRLAELLVRSWRLRIDTAKGAK